MGKMNRRALAEEIVRRAGLSRREAERALAVLLDSISEALVLGDSVHLSGLGSFRVRRHAARQIVEPRTGRIIRYSGRWIPVYRAGRRLRESVRQAHAGLGDGQECAPRAAGID